MGTLVFTIYLLNFIFAFYLVFYREKDTSVTWAWLLCFIMVPVVGFLLYIFFGYGLKGEVFEDVRNQLNQEFKALDLPENRQHDLYNNRASAHDNQLLVNFLDDLTDFPLTHYNSFDLYTDGKKKFDALKADLEAATETIHIEYYAFVTDELGMSIVDILTRKAREGVAVKLLYDALGSKGTDVKKLKPLRDAGGEVTIFITSQRSLKYFRANYHDHHKLVIIDSKIGYIGGFNVSDQYAGTTRKFGYWRDTHVRLYGPIVSLMQLKFLTNWNVSVPKERRVQLTRNLLFVDQSLELSEGVDMQLISSSPDSNRQEIKLTFIKMIFAAKKRIWIQTPYLIPDDSVIDALRIAQKSGIDIKIMIPNKPDHPFIFRVTQFYAEVLIKENVDIFSYQGGFLHSKVMIIDDDISIVGSANQDIRSYKLNFEASIVSFSKELNHELSQAFDKDLLISDQWTQQTFDQMSVWLKFKQKVSRLVSPIM
ncbi:cardiolipin synthase [Vagococcus penaei]|uniref:Cardiolipin synthase n=1 Tax=Vagococcus penaei TaxID=633807 RepID=A0A1Q2D442_9ENTE|nr:cardiolipin synthase [Vagococcus penaei]AQP53129.1 cardiolipin synthase [Vagococcus penaei]RSU06008.1 cardiolipin synthase [Vagococcus penaei]